MSKAVRLPTSLRIGCFDIRVIEWTHRDASAVRRFGEFSCVEETIRVETGERSGPAVLSTLLHEINHVIYWAHNLTDEDKEERVVDTYANAWVQIYRDNPELLRLIGKCLK
jgi:hypothetical protein